MRRPLALATLLVIAGCDRNSPGVDDDRVNSQMIENVAFQGNETADIGASARLQPLGAARPPAGYAGTVCGFARDGQLLVLAYGDRAVARIAGNLRTFGAAGSVGSAGGFWRDRALARSIAAAPGPPARARVTNRLTQAHEDQVGSGPCRP